MSVRKYVTSKYQPQHQWQFTSATRDNTSNGDMSRRRVPLFFKKKRKQYKHLHGEKKKSLPDGVNEDSDHLFSRWAEYERAERGRENRKWDKQVKKEREREKKKQNRSMRRKKKDKNKTDTKRENTSYESRQRERCTAWLPLMRSSSFPVFHSSCYSFFSLSLSLLISPSLADVSSLRLSHVSLHYQASLVCQPRESIAAQTRRRSKEHIKEEGRQMRSDCFFFVFFLTLVRLRYFLDWHDRQRGLYY